jgi:hypothetical protein
MEYTEIKVLISSIAPDHPIGSGKWIIRPVSTSIASSKYDLYSVVIHEIGHMLLCYANQGTMFQNI